MKPYLSIVVAARNDNYGGAFLARAEAFVNLLAALWSAEGAAAELIVVEWNPPEDKPPLMDALTWPGCPPNLTIRIIQVPRELHDSLLNSGKMPMFEYMAKNVGIRRADGEYVLATNPDLLYSEQLVSFMASGTLSEHEFYRADRYDVPRPVPRDLPVREQLNICARSAYRAATVNGFVPLSHNLTRLVHLLRLPDRWPRRMLRRLWRRVKGQARLYTLASGDFFLMAKKHWCEVRGYPEMKSHAFIDGYACFLAASLGLKQVVLKKTMRTYHQEHDRSSQAERPSTDYSQYLEHGRQMTALGRPLILNDESWGLGEQELRDYIIGQ